MFKYFFLSSTLRNPLLGSRNIVYDPATIFHDWYIIREAIRWSLSPPRYGIGQLGAHPPFDMFLFNLVLLGGHTHSRLSDLGGDTDFGR